MFALFNAVSALTLAHAWGYSTCCVCQLPAMAASNSHKSETTSSIATKQGIGMGSVAFSNIIPLKSLSMKCEAREMALSRKDNIRQRYQQVGNRATSKYYMGDYMQALCWQVTVD